MYICTCSDRIFLEITINPQLFILQILFVLAFAYFNLLNCFYGNFWTYFYLLPKFYLLPYSRWRSTCYSDRLHDFSVTIPKCYKDVYVNSFFPRTTRLWNSLPTEYFPLIYDLNGFNSRISRHLLTVGFF